MSSAGSLEQGINGAGGEDYRPDGRVLPSGAGKAARKGTPDGCLEPTVRFEFTTCKLRIGCSTEPLRRHDAVRCWCAVNQIARQEKKVNSTRTSRYCPSCRSRIERRMSMTFAEVMPRRFVDTLIKRLVLGAHQLAPAARSILLRMFGTYQILAGSCRPHASPYRAA